jgi:mannose-1-phosphate guanylyltransferase
MATNKSNMKAVIFAGGVGTRMWPLSRKSTPKQFEKIVGEKSTLQLSIDRLRPEFDWKDIYISTGQRYTHIIKKQLPKIPKSNIIGEPEMKDVAPAVGYLMAILAKKAPNSPVIILWSDHLMKHVNRFKTIVIKGGEYIRKNTDKFLFIGQKPRFANQNLGWIEYGKKLTNLDKYQVSEFKSWHYRPDQKTADKYFKGGKHAWNPGYFIVNPKFVFEQYKKHTPKMYKKLATLQKSYGKFNHKRQLKKIYPTFEKISFDDAILMKVPSKQAVVVSADLGWSDIGTWEALKEALQKKPDDNITEGKVVAFNTKNSVIYNFSDQLVTGIDLDDMVVVTTEDAILVCPQKSIPNIKKMLNTFDGTELEKYR